MENNQVSGVSSTLRNNDMIFLPVKYGLILYHIAPPNF